MKLELRSHTLNLTPVVERQIERRLFIALHSFSRYIDEIAISIRDVNGPRGGRDLLGQVIVRLHGGLPLVVHAKSDSVHRLVAKLATAVRRAVKSRIRRKAQLMRRDRGRQRAARLAPAAGDSQSGERLEDQELRLAI
jgi:hypothetical protein